LDPTYKREKPILKDFAGSDWCPWYIKLDKDIFYKTQLKKLNDAIVSKKKNLNETTAL